MTYPPFDNEFIDGLDGLDELIGLDELLDEFDIPEPNTLFEGDFQTIDGDLDV